MPVQDEQAIGRLIQLGYSNDDIKGIVDMQNNNVTDLVKQGKTNDEIKSIISQTTVNFNGNKIQPWAEDKEVMPTPQVLSGDVAGMDFAGKQQGPTTMQNLATSKAGDVADWLLHSFAGIAPQNLPGTISKAVRDIAPFPGLTKLATGQNVSEYGKEGEILNPLPTAATDLLSSIIGGVNKIDPSGKLGKTLEGAMLASPELNLNAVKNLSLYRSGRAIPDINKMRDVTASTQPETARLALPAPTPILEPQTGPFPLPPSRSSIVGQRGAIFSEGVGPIDLTTIDIAKNARDYGIKIDNNELITKADSILDTANIPLSQREVTPEQHGANSSVAISVANEAKRHAQEVNDPILLNRANQIINNNGVIRPEQIRNPSIHDVPDLAGDLNVIANNKPPVDFSKLEGTAVVNEDGTPKELYHGTPVSFQEFDIAKIKPGLYGSGVYLTDTPEIAGGYTTKDKGWISTQIQEQAPNVRPAYLNIKKPFDIDGPISTQEVINILETNKDVIPEELSRKAFANTIARLQPEGKYLYDTLKKEFTEDQVNNVLVNSGYDGITHIGGKVLGGAPHRVYIAFDPSQVVSKFDPALYAKQMAKSASTERSIDINGEITREPIKLEEEPKNQTDASIAIIKHANENGIQGGEVPTINDLDFKAILDKAFDNKQGEPPSGFGGGLSGPQNPEFLPAPETYEFRGIPWYANGQSALRVFAKMESETGLPVLTELHNTAQIMDANYIQMSTKLRKELVESIREVGKYDKLSIKNQSTWEKVSDALEQIKSYDKSNDVVAFKDANGNMQQGPPATMASRLHYDLDIVKLAARLRNLYDDYWTQGATTNAVNPNAYLDFYNPRKWENRGTDRFNYVKNLREDQRGFFQYPRGNGVYPVDRNAYNLINRYISEWSRIEHITPWQKQVAEPVYKQAMATYANTQRKVETLNYLRDYITDKIRLPRDNAQKANSGLTDFVDNWIAPLRPNLAKNIKYRLGNDRLAEGMDQVLTKWEINGFLKYRPGPMLRNVAQREFALPLIPNGNIDLGLAQIKLLRDPAARHRFLLSGLTPYIESETVSGSGQISPKVGGYQLAEAGNMGSIFLTIHDGIVKDINNNMSLGDMQNKWRLHLYPEPLEKLFAELYNKNQMGTIEEYGPMAGPALLGRYAAMMSQFAKGPGEVPAWARTGPVAKQFWRFSTWSPMTIDYFMNLTHDAIKGPTPYIDMLRIGKLFAYLYMADKTWEAFTGNSLQTNPLTNLPTRAVQGPAPSLLGSGFQYIAAKWNEILNGIVDEDNANTYKWISGQAYKELTRSGPGFIRGGFAAKDIYNFANPKKPKEESIAP